MEKTSDSQVMQADKGGYRQINKTLNICVFESYLKSQAANLGSLPNVEQVSPRVLRVLGQNPGKFTLQGTNTYIVGTGVHRLLIDTSGGELEWSTLMRETLKLKGISLTHVLLTHFHGDHTGGVPDLIRMYPALSGRIYKNQPDKTQQPIVDGQVFAVEGATIRCVHVPGHSTDHMCFVLEEEQAMFTGDNILGHGTSAIEDLGTFMNSLQRMLDRGCKRGYPGHGMLINDLDNKIRGEITAKVRREQQVLQGLKRIRGRGEKSATLSAVVSEIYGASLDEQTRVLALEPFVGEVLRKLAADGKVAFERKAGIKRWYSVEYSVLPRAKTAPGMPLVHVSTFA